MLADNPLKQFSSFSTHFIIKLGKSFTQGGGDQETATLLVDTRGGDDPNNASPRLIVQSFDIYHEFSGISAEITVGNESNLVIYERGGASYLHQLGEVMAEMDITFSASAILWVGVNIVGWSDGVATELKTKWFPHTIVDISMTMRNSGSEYLHQLQGAVYSKSRMLNQNQINIKETVGMSMQDHLDDLMRNANIEAERARITNGTDAFCKSISYSYEIVGDMAISSPVEVSTTAYDVGGVKHISSGGRNGSSTIIEHITAIIKRTPRVLDDLTKTNHQYKIYVRAGKITDTTEEVIYRIVPYERMPANINDTKPLLNLTYFFGGKNEDILEFTFQLDGAFSLIAQGIVSNTAEDIQADPSRVVTQVRNNINQAKTVTTPDSVRAGDTAATAVTPQTSPKTCEVLPKPKKTGFANDMNQNSSSSWNAYDMSLKTAVAPLISSDCRIRGNPLLILDEETVDELGLEGAAALVVFNIGTPLPDFQDSTASQSAPVERFIYSGNYLLRGVKSIFTASGTFEQELTMFYSLDINP